MSSLDCEIIGKGDCDLFKVCKSDPALSRSIAIQIVSEIIESALEIAQDLPSNANIKEVIASKEKGMSCKPLKGTGDQKSDQEFKKEEAPLFEHPPVEKKNRLTDLVKNSKHIWAKLISNSSTNIAIQQEEPDEKIMEVIELDCVQISDLPQTIPEEDEGGIKPYTSKAENVKVPLNEDTMDEIKLSSLDVSKDEATLKRRTFPMGSASNAKANFVAKCRTLKAGATNLKKKKWNVKGKIVNFFKKRCDKESKTHLDEKREHDNVEEKADLETVEDKN